MLRQGSCLSKFTGNFEVFCCSCTVAAEQKARTTYDNILRLADDPDVKDAIRFLREREIVHYQRFGEALRIAQDNLDCKNFYAFNPNFDQAQAAQVAAGK